MAEELGRRRLWITLRLSIALAAVLTVVCFTPSAARADYPLMSKYIPGTAVFQANRPFDLPIDSVMIHDTEGSYQSAVDVFTDPKATTGVQYLVSGQVNSSDPQVTQFVHDKDWARNVNNWWFNETAIGIEHVGFAVDPAGYFTRALYKHSADLAGWAAWKYGIPVDHAHILGHDNIPNSVDNPHVQHRDPGPSWDWPYYMALVRAAYKRWSHNAPVPRPEIPARFTKSSSSIRVISVGDNLASARDWFLWTTGAQYNFTNVYARQGGRPAPDTLVRGASDPSTFIPAAKEGDQPQFNKLDFSCDNFPWVIVPNGPPVISEVSASDLRAKAAWGEEFALLGRKRVRGVLYDKIDFSGTVGWVRDSDTSDGWGALVRFRGGSHPATLFSGPDKTQLI